MTESKEIHIVNNSDEASYFEWLPLEQLHGDAQQSHVSSRYIEIFPMNGEIQPNTITTVVITFKPEDSDDDDIEVMKEVFFSFGLKLSLELDYNPMINIRGKIIGPTFQLDRKQIDIGTVYLGESRFIEVRVTNIGIIGGKVFFQKSSSPFIGIVKVSSKSESFSQGESKTFKIKYLARKPGKFVEQVFFKAKNGERLSFVIQGTIKPLELSIKPTIVQLREIPICAPQMQLVVLKNELPFPVDVKVEIENVGSDEPLEFLEFFQSKKYVEIGENSSVDSVSSLNSNSSQARSLSIESCSFDLARTSIKNFIEQTGKLDNLRDSIAEVTNGISSVYNKVDEYLERTEIVQSILRMIFDRKVNDEIEKRQVVEIIMNLLIESIKESEMTKLTAFHQKEWKFPENPREVETNVKIFKLPAKSDKSFDLKVFVTPNFIGKFSKNLKLKLLISNLSPCPFVDETVINVPIIYECQSPELVIHNSMNSIVGYAESEISLDVLVENIGVDGFFSFSRFEDPEIVIRCDQEKFHIARQSKKIVNLIVTPCKSGLMVKYFNLVVLGSNRKLPVSIECKSLPPDIVIKPNKILENDLDVLVKHESRIVVENRSPTKARIFLRLEHGNEAFELNPLGGILASKQSLMITLAMFFYDPGNYRDTLIVEVVNGKIMVSNFSFFYHHQFNFKLTESSHQMHRSEASNSHRTFVFKIHRLWNTFCLKNSVFSRIQLHQRRRACLHGFYNLQELEKQKRTSLYR